MTTSQEPKSPAAKPRDEQAALRDRIGKNVMLSLGYPGDLRRLQVRSLWDGYYRVNVFTGHDSGPVRIAHSYFLAVNTEGTIVSSTPGIARMY